MDSDPVRLLLFGTPSLRVAGQEVHIPRRKALAIMAYLALAGETVARERLCQLLWPELPTSRARKPLRTTLATVRRVLPAGALITSGEMVGLHTDFLSAVDAVRFTDLTQRISTTLSQHTEALSDENVHLAETALGLARGPFLQTLSLPECPDFDDWQFFTAERFRSTRIELLWSLLRTCSERGAHDRALEYARTLLELEPSDGELHQEVMILLSERGSKRAALDHLNEYRRIFMHQAEHDDAPREDLLSVERLGDIIAQEAGRDRCHAGYSETDDGAAAVHPHERRLVSIVACRTSSTTRHATRSVRESLGTCAMMYRGDAVMVETNTAAMVFGTRVPREDDVDRAARAAQALRSYLRAESVGSAIAVRTCVGDLAELTELVREVSGSVPPGEGRVFLCPLTRTSLSHAWDRNVHSVASDGSFPFELVSDVGPDADVSQPEPEFVGRRRALHDVIGVCRESLAPPGWIALVSGEPGMGKSRLVREAFAILDDDPTLLRQPVIVTCGASEVLMDSEFAAARDLVRPLVSMLSSTNTDTGDPVVACAEHLASAGDILPADILPTVEAIRRLLSPRAAEAGARNTRSTASESFYRETTQAIVALVHRVASMSPLVIAFEDLHWADAGTAGLMAEIAGLTDSCALALIVTFRDEDEETRARSEVIARRAVGRHLHVRLDELPLDAGFSIVRSIAPGAGEHERSVDALVERAGGNPLYLTEMARVLQSTGESEVMPARLLRVTQRRIAGLTRQARNVLFAAATIGDLVPGDLLARVVGSVFPEQEVSTHVSTLIHTGFLRPRSAEGPRELEFSHSLVRACLCELTQTSMRSALHAAIVESAETLEMDARMDPELLAHHAEASGDPQRAFSYYAAAADAARLQFHTERAADLYRRARGASAGLPWDYEVGRVELALGHTLYQLGRFREANEVWADVFRSMAETSYESAPRSETLRLGLYVPFTVDLDPGRAVGQPMKALLRPITRRLIEYRADGVLVPDACASWTVNDDGTRYRFVIRDDARWSDGHPLCAEDFRASIVRTVSRDYAWSESSEYVVAGLDAYGRSGDVNDLGIRAIDDRTIELILERPSTGLLHAFATGMEAAIPTHVRSVVGDKWSAVEHCVYAGRFAVASCDPAKSLVFELNPHFREGWVSSGNVHRVVVSTTRREHLLDAFALGEADLSWVPVEATKRAMYEFGRYLRTGPPTALVLLIPMQSGSRITSPRFRRALGHSIDRRELVRRLYGGMHTPAHGGLIPPTLTGFQPDAGLEYDPDAARRLWAGQPDASHAGEPVRLLTEERFADLAAFLQESWQTTLGIESACTILPFDQFLSAATEPSYEFVLGQISFPLTAESALKSPIIAGDEATPSLPLATRAEQDWLAQEDDQQEQLRRLQELDQRLVRDALRIPLFYSNHYVLVRDTIQSQGLNPSAAGCLDDVRAQRRLPGTSGETGE